MLSSLKKENKRLQADLERLHEAENVSIQPKRGKRGGPSIASLQGKVRQMQREIDQLNKARVKDKKKIKKVMCTHLRLFL